MPNTHAQNVAKADVHTQTQRHREKRRQEPKAERIEGGRHRGVKIPGCSFSVAWVQNNRMIEEWRSDSARVAQDLDELAGVLHAVVHAGASVSFVLPFSLEDARAFWRSKVLPDVRKRRRMVLLARSDGEIVGTVQLILDTPPNQGHRAEVAKLLVHPKARRRGVARALMEAIENVARREGRTLITLDTRTGDMAEPLYRSMGYVLVGIIPRYAIDPHGQALEPTSILYKELR